LHVDVILRRGDGAGRDGFWKMTLQRFGACYAGCARDGGERGAEVGAATWIVCRGGRRLGALGAETGIWGEEGGNIGLEVGGCGKGKGLRKLLEEADREVVEIACPLRPGGVCVGDVAAHGVVDFGGKSREILLVTLGQELDTGVGEVANEAGYREAGCDSADGETKADALDGAGVENVEAFFHGDLLPD